MIYCISDIHGCYDEFMELLKKIDFNSNDTLYVLGDIIDRGKKSIECIKHIMQTPNIHFIMGNHEKLMMDHYAGNDIYNDWNSENGVDPTKNQLKKMTKEEVDEILSYFNESLYYTTVTVNGKNYFLSHAGLKARIHIELQTKDDFVWGRDKFIFNKALHDCICIFGHTPTKYLNESKDDYSIWFDKRYNDKICIDSGCAYGGALAALRLDDMEEFYVESH